MNVCEIVTKYLIENGYSGLYSEDCGCKIGDLFPCQECPDKCKAGYLQEDCDGWWIGTEKPKLK